MASRVEMFFVFVLAAVWVSFIRLAWQQRELVSNYVLAGYGLITISTGLQFGIELVQFVSTVSGAVELLFHKTGIALALFAIGLFIVNYQKREQEVERLRYPSE